MALMRSSNPTLTSAIYTKEAALDAEQKMTIQGTVNKTFILLFLVMLPASMIWSQYFQGANIIGFTAIGGIGGFILALVTVFKRSWSPITAPVYAIMKGMMLGGISAIFESIYPGIVIQAVALTFGTLFSLLAAYKSGWIKVTENFKLGVFSATGAIALIYFATFMLGLFGLNMPYIHGSGPIGIGFSLLVVVIASLNLVMDFDFIEAGAEKGAPKYMEWYSAFGLIVTLIWLYIEFLRLLGKLRSR